ncbi:MAG: sugar phosphate isomerase/epimerase [Clostridiaceae bacterium]|nr:sugar phosphate isomerase/epimerase [Clostridiaceae bacterium]
MPNNLKKGTSLCFIDRLDLEMLIQLKEYGFECVELSFSADTYINKIGYPKNALRYREMADQAGIEIRSIHLPFSGEHDISLLDKEKREKTMEMQFAMIDAAGAAGIKTAVVHPSSEPIPGAERCERKKMSRENIIRLRERCDLHGMVLAVENLPRTCLCNCSAEMIELISGTGAQICFDTNHSLKESNLDFLRAINASGLIIDTLHISDYDFTDERHRLPGDGINDWKGIFELLEIHGYNGPIMYEVSSHPVGRGEITIQELAENIAKLKEGEFEALRS